MATAKRKHGDSETIEIKTKDPITADKRLRNERRGSAKLSLKGWYDLVKSSGRALHPPNIGPNLGVQLLQGTLLSLIGRAVGTSGATVFSGAFVLDVAMNLGS